MHYVEIRKNKHAYKVLLLIRDIFNDVNAVPEMNFGDFDAIDLEEENEWEEILNETDDLMNFMDYSDMLSFDISHIQNINQEIPEIG